MWKYRMAYAPQALLSMSNRWSRQQWKSRITYTPETFHPNSNFFVEPFSLSLSQCVCVCVCLLRYSIGLEFVCDSSSSRGN